MDPKQTTVEPAYRGVVNYLAGVLELAAKGADMETRSRLKDISDAMAAVFDAVERGRNEAASVAIKNTDLNDAAILAKVQAITSKAATDAKASRDKAVALTNALEIKLKAAIEPPLPSVPDIQLVIAGKKSDFRMLFDAIPAPALAETMQVELSERVKSNDEVGVYVLAATDWPLLYLRSRGCEPDAIVFKQQSAAVIRPIIPEPVQALAGVLARVNMPGKEGIRSVLLSIDGYLANALPELEKIGGRSWPTKF